MRKNRLRTCLIWLPFSLWMLWFLLRINATWSSAYSFLVVFTHSLPSLWRWLWTRRWSSRRISWIVWRRMKSEHSPFVTCRNHSRISSISFGIRWPFWRSTWIVPTRTFRQRWAYCIVIIPSMRTRRLLPSRMRSDWIYLFVSHLCYLFPNQTRWATTWNGTKGQNRTSDYPAEGTAQWPTSCFVHSTLSIILSRIVSFTISCANGNQPHIWASGNAE